MDKLSYALGLGIGQQLAQMGAGADLNIDDFAQSIRDVLEGNELKVSHREAQLIVEGYFMQQQQKMTAERAEQGKAAKAEGEKYLAENAKKEGVITTASGLQYQVLREGNGKRPTAKDSVKCRLRPAAGHRRLDRGSAVDAGGWQVSLLHPLPPGLWRGRRRTDDSSLRHFDFRC